MTQNIHDKPREITLIKSKEQYNDIIKYERINKQKISKNKKKRKPKWKLNDNNKHPIKKRKISNQVQTNDLFNVKSHEINHDNDDGNDINDDNDTSDDIKNNDNNDESTNDTINEEKDIEEENPYLNEEIKDDNDIFNDIPEDILIEFENAAKKLKTKKEMKDYWTKLLKERIGNESKLKSLLTKYDTMIVDGFQLEMNNITKLNTSAIKRAYKLEHFSEKTHFRKNFSKQKNAGSQLPSFDFNVSSVAYKITPWGQRIKNDKNISKKQNKLQSMLNDL